MESRVTHSLVTALRDVPGFESVDERVLLALIGESANLYWPEGSTVFRHGTPADGLYIVISGAVRVVGEDGELMVIPKEKFDDLMAAYEDVSRHVRAKAEERAAAGASPAMR